MAARNIPIPFTSPENLTVVFKTTCYSFPEDYSGVLSIYIVLLKPLIIPTPGNLMPSSYICINTPTHTHDPDKHIDKNEFKRKKRQILESFMAQVF